MDHRVPSGPKPQTPCPDVAPAPALLAVRRRNGRVESAHYGHLVVVDARGRVLVSRGAPQAPQYARSTLKPLQALPLVASGAADAFGLSGEALAVACASHAGEAHHVAAVRELLARAGLAESQLQCGVHAPLHAPSALTLACAGETAAPIQGNCSGKHAAMLALCRFQGWDEASYREPEHPLQRGIRAVLAELSGMPAEALGWGVDGCGVPVWHLPLEALALTFARLGAPSGLPGGLAEAAGRLTAAMTRHPELVSGDGRLDTELMRAGAGRLVTKIGGEGVHAGAVAGPDGFGWALKVSDGNRRAIGPVLARMFAELGVVLPESAALAAHWAEPVRNNHGELLGQMEAAW